MKLRIGVDVGGTFTDLAAADLQTGERYIEKVPSTPRAPEEGVLNALDRLFERFEQRPEIEHIAHSTTIATNALLGQMHLELPRVVFLTTYGFRDVLEIGRQNRSEVYNLFVTRPKPLASRDDRIGVRERMGPNGEVLEPLSDAECDRVVAELRARKPDAIAIGFLHSYANDTHERKMAHAIANAMPGITVTQSAQIDPEYREYERFSTAVVNAALAPIVRRYLERLDAALKERGIDAPLYVMQSNGGLAKAQDVVHMPAALIESGPAAGVVAATAYAQTTPRILSFDMGGTTAKAGTIVNGEVQVAHEFEAAGTTHSGRSIKGSGYPVRFPFVDLAEISAGGGTIAFVDEAGALRVGPLSAGADPGPACYGKSDAATITDANVVLGRLSGEALAGGTLPIDASRSRAAVAKLADRLGLSCETTAAGIVRIVDAQMAKVLRIVTVERGLDPRDFAMVAFGGNGPLHACALAGELGMTRILIPADPGVFSAHGLLTAPVRSSAVRPLLRDTQSLEDTELQHLVHRMTQTYAHAHEAHTSISYDARYRGQSFELELHGAPSTAALERQFHEAHRRRYGYDVPGEAVELVNVRLTATAPLERLPPAFVKVNGLGALRARRVWIDGNWHETPVYERTALEEALILEGPALLEQYDTCTFVAPGWRAARYAELIVMERP